jgi:uncharacterized membrane protein YgcG
MKLIISILLACLISPFNVYAADLVLNRPVVDKTNILSKEELKTITKTIIDVRKNGGPQIGVVIINSLDGKNLEDYSKQLANRWGLGSKKKNDGIMLLIALNDHKMRIEVGKGLTDSLDGSDRQGLIRDLGPYFRNHDFSNGILGFINSVSDKKAEEHLISSSDLEQQPEDTQSKYDYINQYNRQQKRETEPDLEVVKKPDTIEVVNVEVVDVKDDIKTTLIILAVISFIGLAFSIDKRTELTKNRETLKQSILDSNSATSETAVLKAAMENKENTLKTLESQLNQFPNYLKNETLKFQLSQQNAENKKLTDSITKVSSDYSTLRKQVGK